MKKSMIVPEKVSPAIIAPPKPRHKGLDKVIGMRPKMAAIEVKAIGSNREEAPSDIDSIYGMPVLIFTTILSTTRIEFLTTIPKRAKTPIKAGNESGVFVRAKMIKTPDIERGITSITMSALLKELN